MGGGNKSCISGVGRLKWTRAPSFLDVKSSRSGENDDCSMVVIVVAEIVVVVVLVIVVVVGCCCCYCCCFFVVVHRAAGLRQLRRGSCGMAHSIRCSFKIID